MSGLCWDERESELRGHKSGLLVADKLTAQFGIWRGKGILECDILYSEWSCTVFWSVNSDMSESSDIEIPMADTLDTPSIIIA
jgi:hypothetical protein